MRRSTPIISAALPFFLFVAATLLFSINLERLPNPDELYQIQAAEGLLATGEPRIADGLYTRAYAQTWLIAQSLSLAGNTLSAARLSSVLAMATLTALLFVWLRPAAGALAAWITVDRVRAIAVRSADGPVRTHLWRAVAELLPGLLLHLSCPQQARGRGRRTGWRWLMAPSRLAFFVLAA